MTCVLPRTVFAGSKFLLDFSYYGSRYLGLQRQRRRQFPTTHEYYDDSIQMALEIGLQNVKPTPVNTITSTPASRTDSKVHAFQNFLVSRLEHPGFPKEEYDPNEITRCVNEYLSSHCHEIRVKKTTKLPIQFRPYKFCEWREYAYRFMLVRDIPKDVLKGRLRKRHWSRSDVDPNGSLKPFLELPWKQRERLSFLTPPMNSSSLDMEKMASALKMMEGEHNFRSFEACTSDINVKGTVFEKNPVKTITLCSLSPLSVETLLKDLQNYDSPIGDSQSLRELYTGKEFYEVRVRGSSFLYRQVRRMIGVAFMYATCSKGMTEERLRFMFENPHRWNWHTGYFMAPPHGLYLAEIKLKPVEECLYGQSRYFVDSDNDNDEDSDEDLKTRSVN